MLQARWSSQFKRDVKTAQKRGKDLRKFELIHFLLAEEKPLPPRNHDHVLTGNWRGCRECHLEPDWLLVYRFQMDEGFIE